MVDGYVLISKNGGYFVNICLKSLKLEMVIRINLYFVEILKLFNNYKNG